MKTNEYDFRTLSPIAFEHLVQDLLNADLGLALRSYAAGRDRGIDLWETGADGAMTVVQCKHYANSSWSTLLRAVRKEAGREYLHTDRYLFVTSRVLSPHQQDQIVAELAGLSVAHVAVWGRDHLNAALSRHPGVSRSWDRRRDDGSMVPHNAREEFAWRLNTLLEDSGLPADRVIHKATLMRLPGGSSPVARSSVSAWRTGRNLPSASNTQAFLHVIRVATEAASHQAAAGYMVDRLIGEAEWVRLLMTARSTPPPRGRRRRNIATAEQVATAKLLFRIYVPSERLYAAEAHEVLSLFRDWLIKARGHRVRQSGYRTKSGEVYEFFADDSAVQVDLRDEFGNFSGFLGLCSTDPEAAADVLAAAGVERASSTDLVARFAKDARRLHTDLRHERERRMLTLRHSLEGELVDSGVDLQGGTGSHLSALLERLVPGPSAPDPLAQWRCFKV